MQIGSHYHFGECNSYLKFDRALAFGKRLNVPAGTAVRFEPGDIKRVSLVEIAGNKVLTALVSAEFLHGTAACRAHASRGFDLPLALRIPHLQSCYCTP